MAERQPYEAHHANDPPLQSSTASKEDIISYVAALEATLLPCLPARGLQAIDRSPHPSHQIDVERHARDFIEAAEKLQLYFISLQREDQPTRLETLQKKIAMMEEELKMKNISYQEPGEADSRMEIRFEQPISQTQYRAGESIVE